MADVLPTVAPRKSLLALERIPAPVWVLGLVLLAMPAFASNFVLFQIFGWSFILALYAGLQNATGLVVPVLGLAAILWARRPFRTPATDRTRAAEVLTGAA